MVSWGMGHNLEKNLERVQTLRAKGQLDRALKSLQDWAEKHPDTPHYQFEAAMIAFELSDWNTGLTALRALVRKLPETREKVLGACREQFDAVPALPLAEYLLEQSLLDQDLETALGLVERLDEENRGVFLRKLQMRRHGAPAADEPMVPKVLHGLTVQFLLACSLPDGKVARKVVGDLIRESEFAVHEWTRLIDRALKLEPQNIDLMVARAEALGAEMKLDLAGESLVRVARLDESEIQNCLALLHCIEPDAAGRGAWYLAEGHLHLLARDGAAGAESWTHAADAAPKLREQILDGLERPSENTSLPGREEALKLRLRLLVVQKHFDQIPELARKLVEEGLAEPGELRALLGEGQDIELPTEMKAVLAEIALRDGDLVAAAGMAYEIPTSDEHSCRRLLRAIDAMIDRWDAASRLQLLALRAVLRARLQDRNGANGALVDAWRQYPGEVDTLTAVSDRCLQDVEPLPEFVAAAMAALFDADRTDWVDGPFRQICPDPDGSGATHSPHSGGLNFGGMDPGAFSQESLSLDLGDDAEPSYADELAPLVLDLLREKPTRGAAFLRFFDELARPDLEPALRHPIALAALHAGDTKRALPTFALLTMMAQPMFLAEIAEDYDEALKTWDENVELLLARAELHIELRELEPAAELFDRALRLQPARANDVVDGFDRMLELADEETAPRLRASLAEALFEVRAFDRLAELCRRAVAGTEGSEQVPYLALQIRMATARGEFSAALQLIQQHSVKGPMPATTGVELLEEILEAHPASSISWLLLGQLATHAGQLNRALEAYVEAIRIDPSLEQPVAEQINEISASPGADTDLLVGVGRFHLRRNAPDRAAYALSRALELDHGAAERVLRELEPFLVDDGCSLDVATTGARACRLAGQPDRAVALVMRIEERDPQRLETVLAELRDLRNAFPDLVLPTASMAEVLWRRNSPDAAMRVVCEAAAVEGYDLAERVQLLRSFHERTPGNTAVALALADLLSEQGDRTGACQLIEANMDRPDFDAELGAEVTGRLHRRFAEHAGLALLNHDILSRCGRVGEALRSLPPAAALDREMLAAVNARYGQHRNHVLRSPDLALDYGRALLREERGDEALEVFEAAASTDDFPPSHPLLMEWAGLLHARGETARSAAILREHFADEEQRREAYAQFGRWNQERREAELESLRSRFAEDPDDLECAFDIARILLEVERAAEARELLAPLRASQELRPRRAILLSRAHLELERAEDAEAILLDAIRGVAADHEDFGEIQYHLADCAGRLGRPEEATSRLRGLLADPRYAEQARARVRANYAHHLSEVAGERRAVLTAVSSLQSNPSRNER